MCVENCSECSNVLCRCADCFCLVEGEHGEMWCDEYEMPCEEVTVCIELN